ncbi:MAG TPA: hypothetical protein VGL61_18390 [Kofleriaceae bacterium]
MTGEVAAAAIRASSRRASYGGVVSSRYAPQLAARSCGFVGSPDRCVRSPDRLVRSPDRFVRSPDRFVRSPDRFVRSPDRFVRSPDRLVRSPDHFDLLGARR